MTRPRSSRPPTPRPRRIAGRDRAVPPRAPASEPEQAAEEETAVEAGPESDEAVSGDPGFDETPAGAEPEQPEPERPEPEQPDDVAEDHEPEDEEPGDDEPGDDEPDEDGSDEDGQADDQERGTGLASSPRTTKVLMSLLVVLAVLAVAGGVFLYVDGRGVSGPDDVEQATDERPVRITNQDAQLAVSVAAEAAQTIISTSYQDYDKQLEEALGLMTPEFAEEFRQASEDVENEVVKAKTEVEVEIRAQGVHRADERQVQALIFLNQLVTKNEKKPVLSPYRVLVTMERTGDGWLVAGLDTK